MVKKDVVAGPPEASMQKVSDSLSAQAEMAIKCVSIYQEQTEKALEFWMDVAAKAMADGQKAMKEWADLANEVAGDTRKAVEANLREVTRMITRSG